MMNRLWIIMFLGVMGLSAPVTAQVDQLANAQILLEEGRVSEVIEIYEGVVAEGYSSGSLQANLGRLYYEEGDLAKAILHYERAQRIRPSDASISQAIEDLTRELEVRIPEVPDFILITLFRSVVLSMPSWFWSIGQLFFGAGFLYILYMQWMVKSPKRSGQPWLYATAVMCLLFLVMSFSSRSIRKLSSTGIVMEPDTMLLTAPDHLSPVVSDLSEGNKVWIEDVIGVWYKVRLRNRDQGYVQIKKVTKI
ncbi:MAG: tetratricopeptide repeat protein [Bacteroidota bacterium]